MNAIGRQDSFKRGLDYFHGSGGENVKIEAIALNAVIENLVEQADIGLEADFLADLD